MNEAKSAVASVFGRKFLGYAFWVAPGYVVKRRVADKAIKAFKDRIRDLMPRVTGRSLRAVTERLRHRLRAIQLKQWKRGRTIFRELTALGAKPDVAQRAAGNSRCWWRNSGMLINSVLTNKWTDRMGKPRLA